MDAFEAICDPVRRDILSDLHSAERNAGEIARGYDVSRPAISRHLRVLREVGLVTARAEGRERIYSLDTAPLAVVAGWLSSLSTGSEATETGQATETAARRKSAPIGDTHLDALATEIARTRRERRRTGTSDNQQRKDSA